MASKKNRALRAAQVSPLFAKFSTCRLNGPTTNPNPKVRKSGAVGKAVLAQGPGFDGAKSFFFFLKQ